MSDEKIFQRVQDELNGKPRKYTDKALMTKAEVLCEGDENKIMYTYIKLRVEKLKKEEEERFKKEESKELELKFKEEKKIADAELKAKKSSNTIKFWLRVIGIVILIRIISINVSNLL